jgi:hypothetical protein
MEAKKKTAKKKIVKKKAAKKKTSRKKAKKKNAKSSGNKTKKRNGAPKGNQFWKARSSHGRKPIFSSPEQLWDACVQYFEWVEENPLQEEKVFSYLGGITRTTISKMRAMTQGGLCIFLDITDFTWREYGKKNGVISDDNGESYDEAKDFSRVVSAVEKIIYDQKFTGAAADLFNSNIIARDLGLKDKVENEHTGPGGGPVQTRQLSRGEWKDVRKEMLKQDDC